MSSTEAMTEGGVAPDARVTRAMGEARQVLEQARKRAQGTEALRRVQQATMLLEQAGQHVQTGAIDAAMWRHIGEAVMLADQIGRSPR
jgi:hypothetical protein